MIETGRINKSQVSFIMLPTIIATAILSIPSIDAKFAGHDMWMTPIIGSLNGFLTVFIVWKLHKLYPNQTPIQYFEKIIGKYAGKLMGLIFVLFYIQVSGIIIREYTDFLKTEVMPQTPGIVLAISLLFTAALAVRGGLEVIARTAVICTTLYMSTLSVLLLLIKDIDLSYLLPFMENGFIPVLKGAFVHQSWFSEFFLLAFLLPFLKNQNGSLKAGIKTVFLVMVDLIIVNFFILTILGMTAANKFYPVYSIIKSISFLGFFQNFEIAVTASWVLGSFVKITVFLYAASIALAQLFRLNNYQIIVYPLSLVILHFSYWDIPRFATLTNFIYKVLPFYLVTFQTIIPLLLLIIALLRKRWGENFS